MNIKNNKEKNRPRSKQLLLLKKSEITIEIWTSLKILSNPSFVMNLLLSGRWLTQGNCVFSFQMICQAVCHLVQCDKYRQKEQPHQVIVIPESSKKHFWSAVCVHRKHLITTLTLSLFSWFKKKYLISFIRSFSRVIRPHSSSRMFTSLK